MRLIKFYENGENLVFAMAIEGKSYFFFSGFESAEDAKNAIIGTVTGMQKTILEIGLCGEWSEIE